MTHRLILIRHAKSSWDDMFADDHERVLNKRGKASAGAIGQWLDQNAYHPDLILCSDATRTRQTADLIMPELSCAPQLSLSSALYHAAPATVFEMLQKQQAQTIAIIGHNPGIGMVANALAAQPADHPRFGDYPTCATTVLDFSMESWSHLEPGQGRVINFIVPRDLIGASNTDTAQP